MMIHKAIVISFSLLMLPSLSQAQCVNQTAVQCSDTKSAEVTTGDATDTPTRTIIDTAESETINDAATTAKANYSSRKNKRSREHNYPRFETADPRDTVLSSEICVYSSATYTYTCR